MNRRLFQRCVLWLLPLLMLRAIVPAGFMVSAAANGLELTFCSAQVMPAGDASHPAVDVAAHAGHDMATMGEGGADPHAAHHNAGKHFDSPCPFGVAATAIAAALPPVTVATVAAAVGIFEFASAPAISAGPIRADRIRGPPLFS